MAHAVAGFRADVCRGPGGRAAAVAARRSALAWSLVLWLCHRGADLGRWRGRLASRCRSADRFCSPRCWSSASRFPTPGGVGGVARGVRLALTSFYGADNDAAVGAAIVQHAVNFVPVTLLGLWFIARDGSDAWVALRDLSVGRVAR